MKRVKIWEPELKKEKKGKEVVTSISKKKGKLLKTCTVMDNTLRNAKAGGDAFIIERKKYFEEVPFPKKKDDKGANNDSKSEKPKEPVKPE